jgi:8-oxo-dGTP diphosphatase
MAQDLLTKEKLSQVGNPSKCPIAIMMRGDSVLTGFRNYTKDISVWTIPGGRCEEGETIEEALRREVREEVGITDFEIVSFVAELPGAKEGDVVVIFFCTTMQDATLMEPEKFSKWCWITKDEYINNEKYAGFSPLARGAIVDFLKSV